MPDLLDQHAALIRMTASALGPDSLDDVPRWMSKLLKESAWCNFRSPVYKKVVTYQEDEFQKFLTTNWDEGLGREDGIAGMIRICEAVGGKDADEALRLLKAQMAPARAVGRPTKEANVDNNNITTGGDSESYILSRLKRDSPELAAKVVQGTLSAHAAAVQAGFRRRHAQVDMDDARRAAKQLRARCTAEFIDELIAHLLPVVN